MNLSLQNQWQVTRQKLNEAYQLLRDLRSDTEAERCFSDFRDALDHNELELALDALEYMKESSNLSAAVWEAFAVAAESMKLNDRAEACRKMKPEIK